MNESLEAASIADSVDGVNAVNRVDSLENMEDEVKADLALSQAIALAIEQKEKDAELAEEGAEPEVEKKEETTVLEKEKEKEKTHPLNDRWWLWTHGMKDDDWSVSSYKRLGDSIVTVEQFLGLNKKLKDCVADSMFFLMRHGPGDEENPICPMWEDPICIKGGAWKYKVNRCDAATAWTEIAIRLLGETITKTPGDILGVSISPKKTFVTIRIWNTDSKKNDPAQLLIPDSEYFRNVIFDVHADYKDSVQTN